MTSTWAYQPQGVCRCRLWQPKILGALIGGLTIGLIEMFAGTYLPQGFKDVAAYVVLLVVLAVRPQGMFGTVGRKKV